MMPSQFCLRRHPDGDASHRIFVVVPILLFSSFVFVEGFLITQSSGINNLPDIFTSPSFPNFQSSFQRRRIHQHVLKNPNVASTSSDIETNQNEEDWWKDVTFPHGHVSTSSRCDFDILQTTLDNQKPLVYLDSAATSQKPRQVLTDMTDYYESINSNVHRGAHTLSRKATTAFEDARDTVANFVNAKNRNEIIFTSGATEAINLVANSYGRTNFKLGDEIVLTEMEHHSNIVPWQIIAQETGGGLKFAKIDFVNGGLNLVHFESLLNENTKMVACQHISNVMGCIHPVQDMVQLVRKKAHPDAKILLDACQSVPHMPVDVQDLGVDFLAASGHKMCGPTGIGFLWGNEDLLNSMPPFMGGGEMIDQVTLEGSTFAQAPARFEAGTPPIAQAIGLASAIRYLQQNVGMDQIQAYEHELGEYLYKRLTAVDRVHVLGPPQGIQRAALCAFYVDGVHPSDLSTFLDMEGIAIRAGHHCCQPLHHAKGISHSARASLYFYNNKEDIDYFIEKLKKTIQFFVNLEKKDSDDSANGGDDGFVPFI